MYIMTQNKGEGMGAQEGSSQGGVLVLIIIIRDQGMEDSALANHLRHMEREG